MNYTVKLHPAVKKQLRRIDKKHQERIALKIEALAADPYPVGCESLSGRDGYRVRVGDYRIIYEVVEVVLLVHVVRIGHRKDVYKK